MLNWRKEVTYNFEYEGYSYKEHIYVNDVDGKRYRLFDDDVSGSMTPITQTSTGNEYQEIDAVLIGVRVVADRDDFKSYQLLYFLSDINNHILINFNLEPNEDEGEDGEESNNQDLIPYWHYNIMPF